MTPATRVQLWSFSTLSILKLAIQIRSSNLGQILLSASSPHLSLLSLSPAISQLACRARRLIARAYRRGAPRKRSTNASP